MIREMPKAPQNAALLLIIDKMMKAVIVLFGI